MSYRDEKADGLRELPTRSAFGNAGRKIGSDESDASTQTINTRATSVSVSLQPPSEAEASSFYYGLAGIDGSPPRLIARSSEYVFDTPPWIGNFLQEKLMFNVGKHRIIDVYDAHGIRYEVRAMLDKVTWYTIDVLRIGYSSKANENPVVVLITVQRGTLFWQGHAAVKSCREVLLK